MNSKRQASACGGCRGCRWLTGGHEEQGGQSAWADHCPQTHPTRPTHHPATRQTTRQTLRVYLRQRRRPAKQKVTQPRVRVHHGVAEGQRTQESRVRTRNKLGELGGRREKRERKRKLSVRKEPWRLTAETEHVMARRVPHCAIAASARCAHVKRNGKGRSFPGTLAKGEAGKGREQVGDSQIHRLSTTVSKSQAL